MAVSSRLAEERSTELEFLQFVCQRFDEQGPRIPVPVLGLPRFTRGTVKMFERFSVIIQPLYGFLMTVRTATTNKRARREDNPCS